VPKAEFVSHVNRLSNGLVDYGLRDGEAVAGVLSNGVRPRSRELRLQRMRQNPVGSQAGGRCRELQREGVSGALQNVDPCL
jgi:hypothetical protein